MIVRDNKISMMQDWTKECKESNIVGIIKQKNSNLNNKKEFIIKKYYCKTKEIQMGKNNIT